MRKVMLATVALMGLLTFTALHASAAPSIGLVEAGAAPIHGSVTNVYYNWHHHHWHHRRWHHGRWHYWD